MMVSTNPTAKGCWQATLEQVFPALTLLPLHNVYLIGPFDNVDYRGLETAYPPEQEMDLNVVYPGKDGDVSWRHIPGLEGTLEQPVDFGAWLPAEKWSVLYLHAEIEAPEPHIAELVVDSPAIVRAWVNGQPVLSPAIPHSANSQDDRAFIALHPGTNTLLLKLHFSTAQWRIEWRCANYGAPEMVERAFKDLMTRASDDDLIRLLAHFALAEIHAVQGDEKATRGVLNALRHDSFATQWDIAWADAVERQYATTGSFLPLNDVAVSYTPVTQIEAYPTFWPQSPLPARELLVVDVSAATPQLEFALSVLQGLVNREQPRLYLLHTRYDQQDRQWLDELHFEGYTSRQVTISEVWTIFRDEINGVVLYDGSIMDEIGDFHSNRLNQTNVLMMIGGLEKVVPVTSEMNETLKLPVLFDARSAWASQYEMIRWAYNELFPRMNHRILATHYPGIFLITDYLVAFKIFTFWFPEHRVLPEENLLRGILASTPPNTPIVGWWFDWMPAPKDPEYLSADAVMEGPGVLYGSAFGKVLTPSHEATNLSVHSGVPVGPYRHKMPDTPEFDPGKVYYAHIISDGDNLGEALMMRTRDLQWDKPERGSFPMGWSFAPAAARMAPPVLNYYLRTATANDLLVGGLGVGYTHPMIYLRAYPEQREELYAAYARKTDEALGWIDSSCLWLIDGRDEEEDRYARGSSGQLQGIFTGYGGSPEVARARLAPNGVVAFRSATRFEYGKPKEELIRIMVDEIRRAAGETRPAFIEAWVLNWSWSMDMLQEVECQLGPDFVCVRPDVLVVLRKKGAE
ncbi:MAG: hypothetical protein JXA33_22015 [Anaerolineae bacterium]|nr:hypothetical protein [Anaerolineae bacterium]